MTDALPTEAAATTPPEAGTIRWFDAAKKMGVIIRGDGSTIFIPPYGIAEGQEALTAGQSVTFVVRVNKKGDYAAQVQVNSAAGPSIVDIAGELAQALGETLPQALAQIRRIVRHLGADTAWDFVSQAREVEAAGGLMIPDGSRRRTFGGVFFALVRDSLPEAQQAIIFPPIYSHRAKKAKSTSAAPAEPAPPPPPPLTWDDRSALIEALRAQSGKAATVKVTIIGRPATIDEQPQVTLLTLTHSGPLPALPKGIPAPDPMPATTYSVYIGKKQWKTVAEALQNPADVLIVEGTQMLDNATGTIAVFATKTTTKLLQQASRLPRTPAGE